LRLLSRHNTETGSWKSRRESDIFLTDFLPELDLMAGRPFYEFGPFRLDATGRLLFRGTEPVPLPPKAVDTLVLLVQNAGNVVDKEILLKQVWQGAFVEEGSLTRAISVLRKALDDGEDGQEFIATISRRGYRFTMPVKVVDTVPANPLIQDSRLPATAIRGSRKRIVPWLLVGSLMAAILAVVALPNLGNLRNRFLGNSATPPAIRSLAVLPLENLSRDPEQEYFADGMTEELTTEFAQISSLKVISHTSVVQYKGTKKSLPEIARELGVDAVVEGAVERSGDKVGITVQLIQAPSDRHLWANSYERDLHDVLGLQREVTHAIVDEIQAKLTAPERARLAGAQSVDWQAHEDYLRGRFSLEKRELNKSILYFQAAIQQDSNYALAYAGLANAYICLGQPWFREGDMRPQDVFPKAEAAARKALQVDPSLGEGHLALARVIQLYDWDWPSVEREYRTALELTPNDALAYAFFGEFLQEMGRDEEALENFRRASVLNPLDDGTGGIGFLFYTTRQYNAAIREFHKALEFDPSFIDTHVGLGWVYQQKKMYPEAIAELQKAVNLSNRHEVPLASLGQVLGESGRKQEATKILDELKRRSDQRYVSPCLLALVQIGLGQRDHAIASLEQGYTNRDQWMLYLKVDPHMDDLRSDPRFRDLLRRVNIPA
jgi:TolB-like protein/DNA-binding winged helix-turn-helix (wHTH) protein/Tfp pilus assembly protein PilF